MRIPLPGPITSGKSHLFQTVYGKHLSPYYWSSSHWMMKETAKYTSSAETPLIFKISFPFVLFLRTLNFWIKSSLMWKLWLAWSNKRLSATTSPSLLYPERSPWSRDLFKILEEDLWESVTVCFNQEIRSPFIILPRYSQMLYNSLRIALRLIRQHRQSVCLSDFGIVVDRATNIWKDSKWLNFPLNVGVSGG